MSSRRIGELRARRAALIEVSGALRAQARAEIEGLAPAVHGLGRVGGVLARLRRLPVRFIVTAARAGLGDALSNEARRATLLAGAATGIMALVRRWRRRAPPAGGAGNEGAGHDES